MEAQTNPCFCSPKDLVVLRVFVHSCDDKTPCFRGRIKKGRIGCPTRPKGIIRLLFVTGRNGLLGRARIVVRAGTQANHGDSQNDHSEVFHLNISLLSYAGCREAVRIERGGKTTLFSNKFIRVSLRVDKGR